MTQQNGFIQERVRTALYDTGDVQGQVDGQLSKPGSAVQCKVKEYTDFESPGRMSVHSHSTLIIGNHRSSCHIYVSRF